MTAPLSSSLSRGTPLGTPLAARLSPWIWLAAGAVITVGTGPRWNIPALGWLAPVPYLLFARRAQGWRAWIAMFGVMLTGACLQVIAFATPPVPVLGVIGFAPPLAIIWFASTAMAELVRRRVGEATGMFAFTAMTAVMSWLGFGVTELGAWMSPSTTQVTELGFLQLAALGGLAGLGFVMAWFAAVTAMLLGASRDSWSVRPALALAGVLVIGLAWAAFRIDEPAATRTVTVGAITTDLGMGEKGLPSAGQLAANTDQLFERTRVAARRGARLVVWNEVATVVMPAEEAAFVARGQSIARELGIDLVLAYAVLESADPILLDNKYLFISDAGAILDEYQKHHPVPGEPSIRGTGPLRVLERPYAKVAAAICYDYDFPAMAREHAAAGAELVVLPSSDWRGIDPVHTQMARVRAIEGGFSLVRSVRWAASGAFDAKGRTYAWMPTTQHDFVMMATVPVEHVTTFYAQTGEIVVALSGLFLATAIVLALRPRRQNAVTTISPV